MGCHIWKDLLSNLLKATDVLHLNGAGRTKSVRRLREASIPLTSPFVLLCLSYISCLSLCLAAVVKVVAKPVTVYAPSGMIPERVVHSPIFSAST